MSDKRQTTHRMSDWVIMLALAIRRCCAFSVRLSLRSDRLSSSFQARSFLVAPSNRMLSSLAW